MSAAVSQAMLGMLTVLIVSDIVTSIDVINCALTPALLHRKETSITKLNIYHQMENYDISS